VSREQKAREVVLVVREWGEWGEWELAVFGMALQRLRQRLMSGSWVGQIEIYRF